MVDHLWYPVPGSATPKQRLQQVRQALKRHQWLVWLIAGVLALLISWGPWLGGVGFLPLGISLAGLIMVVTVDGWQGVLGLLKRSVQWRVSLRWYALAFLLPAVLALVALGLHTLFGGQPPSMAVYSRLWLSLPLYVAVAILNPLAGPVGQEVLGLRGYGLSKMHVQAGALGASLIIGSFWGLWHLPEFFDPNSPQSALGWGFYPPYVLLEIAISIIITWVYNHTRESVLVSAILMNMAFNFWWAALLTQASSTSGREFPPLDPQVFGWNIALTVLLALILVVLTRGRLGEGPRPPAAVPTPLPLGTPGPELPGPASGEQPVARAQSGSID